jgi:hypothetical protein
MNAPTPNNHQAQALAKLREILRPGDTVHCVRRHTSRSGASRSVSLFVSIGGDLVELDTLAAPALAHQLDKKHGGIRSYMPEYLDPGAALVDALAAALAFPLTHRAL